MHVRGLLIATGALAATLSAVAHDSPGDVIHALTHRIDTAGPTARLLAARAFEYEYLGQWEAAAADFEAALALQPAYGAAWTGLAQVRLRQGRLDGARAAARQGLELEEDPAKKAPFQAILAEVCSARKDWQPALEAWREALKSPRPEVDWFLGEADCLARLDRYPERAAALAAAAARNPSVVLYRTWVRALVEAGALDEASREIERGLENAHWKSTWLLLRARVHAQRREGAEQEADAAAALEEIRSRWNRDHPDQDPYLIADASLAFALLGEHAEAREFLERARTEGVPDAHLLEIQKLIAPPDATKP